MWRIARYINIIWSLLITALRNRCSVHQATKCFVCNLHTIQLTFTSFSGQHGVSDEGMFLSSLKMSNKCVHKWLYEQKKGVFYAYRMIQYLVVVNKVLIKEILLIAYLTYTFGPFSSSCNMNFYPQWRLPFSLWSWDPSCTSTRHCSCFVYIHHITSVIRRLAARVNWASKFRSRLAAKLAASYYVLFYYIDIVDTECAQLTSADPLRVGAGPIETSAIW